MLVVCLDHLLCDFRVENVYDRVSQNFDKALPQQISFTVKEAENASDVNVYCFGRKL